MKFSTHVKQFAVIIHYYSLKKKKDAKTRESTIHISVHSCPKCRCFPFKWFKVVGEKASFSWVFNWDQRGTWKTQGKKNLLEMFHSGKHSHCPVKKLLHENPGTNLSIRKERENLLTQYQVSTFAMNFTGSLLLTTWQYILPMKVKL